jgi:hypothetical protein
MDHPSEALMRTEYSCRIFDFQTVNVRMSARSMPRDGAHGALASEHYHLEELVGRKTAGALRSFGGGEHPPY